MNVRTSIIKFFLVVCVLIPYTAKAEVENIDVNQASKYISSGEYILVDVRQAGEFASGHIKGAVNIDYYDDNFSTIFEKQFPDKNKTYILYCRSGARSMYAADMLQKLGYKNLKNMQGGILLWQSLGKDIEK